MELVMADAPDSASWETSLAASHLAPLAADWRRWWRAGLSDRSVGRFRTRGHGARSRCAVLLVGLAALACTAGPNATRPSAPGAEPAVPAPAAAAGASSAVPT